MQDVEHGTGNGDPNPGEFDGERWNELLKASFEGTISPDELQEFQDLSDGYTGTKSRGTAAEYERWHDLLRASFDGTMTKAEFREYQKLSEQLMPERKD